MLPSKPVAQLLGANYNKEEYSPHFNQMVHKVVNKIYHKKCRRKLFNTNVVNPSLDQFVQNEHPLGYLNGRKNSPQGKHSYFFQNLKHGRPGYEKEIQNDHKSMTFHLSKSKNYSDESNKKCKTEHNTETSSPEFNKMQLKKQIRCFKNRCLMTRQLKIQEKSRTTFGLGQAFANRISPYNFKKNFKNRRVETTQNLNQTSSMRGTQNNPRSSSLPIQFSDDCTPWQTNDFQEKKMFQNYLQPQDSQIGDNHLDSLQEELKQLIEKAKTLALSCKVGRYEESQFKVDGRGELILPEYIPHINYNEQFWKKYLKNQINFAIIKELSLKIQQLQNQLKQIDNVSQEYQKLYKIKHRKKNRRLANQIQKAYQCPYQNCYKVYGSDVSLNLHIKLKHGGGNKTDRDQLAEQICLAQSKGLPRPEMRFNLPKGFLDSYRKTFIQKQESEDEDNWLELKKRQMLKLHQQRDEQNPLSS